MILSTPINLNKDEATKYLAENGVFIICSADLIEFGSSDEEQHWLIESDRVRIK